MTDDTEAPVTAPPKPFGIASAYTQWQNKQTPESLADVVEAMRPMIDYRVSAHGGADNPKMRHQAKLIAADSIRRFNPAAGANLQSWVQTNLQGLNRYRRESQGPVKVPERASLDAWSLELASRRFQDDHDREPDVRELADASGLSVKRIADVRKATRPIGSEAQSMASPEAHQADFLGEAMEYLYGELDYVDRRIIDMTTGYGGTEMLPKNVIAQRLGISPSQVTRRSDAIAKRLQAMEDDLQSAYT